MRVIWVDVDNPVVRVYEESLMTTVPEVGAVFDFGTDAMPDTWHVLSVERPWLDGMPNPAHVRVNIIRHGRLA